jgi:predicted transcriptional regulator
MIPQNVPAQYRNLVKLAVAEALTELGITAGEISERNAFKVYGSWFRHAVADGRIRAHRNGSGRTSKKMYNVAEILALKASDTESATLIIR